MVNDIRLAKNSGSTSVTTVGTHAAASGTATEPTANRTDVDSNELAGDWRVTSADVANTPLPVELIAFVGAFEDNQVTLAWSTASEFNNAYFELERSRDGKSFQKIATLEGNGTTNQVSEYTFNDPKYLIGTSYYRLTQVDFDGQSETFQPIAVQAQNIQQAQLTLYPNPTNNKVHIQIGRHK